MLRPTRANRVKLIWLLFGLGLLMPSGVHAEERVDYRMGPYTLRNCQGTTPRDNRPQTAADPVNVAFFGPFASWQNSQRAVGFEYEYEDTSPPGITRGLKWRTTGGNSGGTQRIVNGAACTTQNQASSRGSGFRGGPNAKRHTRFFEQILPFVADPDGTDKSLLTVQDAHRDLKSRRCRGPGSFLGGPVNDRVPRKIDGFTDGGYNNAQRLFTAGFPTPGDNGAAVRVTDFVQTPRRMRFIQCAGEQPPRRYSVGWNGVLAFFYAYSRIPCQDSIRPFDDDAWRFAVCPRGGREGHF